MIVFLNDKFVPLEKAKVSVFDRGFLFADGVYEFIRTYNNKLFEFEAHINRLKYSLNELKINFNDFDKIKDIILKLAVINNFTEKEFEVYIQITRGYQFPRKHNFNEDINPTVFIFLNESENLRDKLNKGVKVILEEDKRWNRCDIKSISLIPAVLAKTKALKSSAFESIFTKDNKILEGSHTNFFGVYKNEVYTAPLSNLILSGITRKVVIKLCRTNNIKVNEEYIKLDELNFFDEFFITGTKTEITPVVQINDKLVNNGMPGKLTSIIQKYFYDYINSQRNSLT
ncbi:MAG: aminotransferase class IV [Ignavibacterium sp.]|nr:aminotransferase class IV [Ignavibacterium sp.]